MNTDRIDRERAAFRAELARGRTDAECAVEGALRRLLASAEAVHSFGLPDYIPPRTAVGFCDAQAEARDVLAKAVRP